MKKHGGDKRLLCFFAKSERERSVFLTLDVLFVGFLEYLLRIVLSRRVGWAGAGGSVRQVCAWL